MTLPPPPLGIPPDQLRGGVPDAVFDLAVNRAAAALRGLPLPAVTEPASASARALAQWHARTRFARRVPIEAVAEALAVRPVAEWTNETANEDVQGSAAQSAGKEAKVVWHWTGGLSGGWKEGKAPFP